MSCAAVPQDAEASELFNLGALKGPKGGLSKASEASALDDEDMEQLDAPSSDEEVRGGPAGCALHVTTLSDLISHYMEWIGLALYWAGYV